MNMNKAAMPAGAAKAAKVSGGTLERRALSHSAARAAVNRPVTTARRR
jgi:hypothetical protein